MEHCTAGRSISNTVVNSCSKSLGREIDEKLWESEDLKPEEVPEELKESGAIAVSLRDVRDSIGRAREQWKLALHSELQPLRETGAIHEVVHVP